MIERSRQDISIKHQCELLGLSRSSYYYHPLGESPFNLDLMKRIDRLYTDHPFLGSRQMTYLLRNQSFFVNHKRVSRLMQKMGIQAITPRKRTSIRDRSARIYPYLLRGVPISRPNQVWCSDITYIPMYQSFLYLVAIMDWYSRYVITWELSNTLDADFCVSALLRALKINLPQIFNTDQGCQFTCEAFINILEGNRIQISMTGKGRVFDNIFIERLWRSVKYEEVYLKDYQSGREAYESLKAYFQFYNYQRGHSALQGLTPAYIYSKKALNNELFKTNIHLNFA